MASPNDIKKGTVINQNGDLWIVVDFQRVSPGKGGSFVRTKMKNLKSGKVNDINFKAAEQLAFELVSHMKMQFLFSEGDLYTFMDNTTFEQYTISKADIEDEVKYLKEGLEVTVVIHNDNAIGITLPMKIQYSIAYTEPATKGDTASGNVTKEAELDNGLKAKVPMFINQGDEIMINTGTGDYTERVSK